ncbi:MAG: GNAT family N-acetyltransferase [Ardenticatenaceae bacterium]
MLYKLTPDLFYRAAPLFGEQIKHHLFCAGVLAGNYSGQVIVDAPEQPRSALVIKDGMWCYLGGEAKNEAFNEALRVALAEKEMIGKQTGALLVSVSSKTWRDVLDSLIPDRETIRMPRRLYVASREHFKRSSGLPDGFALRFMDDSLPAQVQDTLPEDVQKVLALRASAKEPDQAAFGFVALSDQRCEAGKRALAAYAMVDCIVGPKGEIGLFTEPAFRRRGLALATSAATIAYAVPELVERALSHGLTDIHWDCATSNLGSLRIAEKLGLELRLEHDLYLLIFQKVGYLINLAWSHLDLGHFQATLDAGQPLLTLDGAIKHGHFLAGAAWAGLGHQKQAFTHLNHAVDHGWDDVAEIENSLPLRPLHGTEGWAGLMARLASH